MPKVSIIIPISNSVDFLAECLASVEMQTLDGLEVLCVDCGSDDATRSIYELFAHDNPIFHCIVDERATSRPLARNVGLQHATGEYIAFLDSSDWYSDADGLKKLYEAAVREQANVAGGSARLFDNRTNDLHMEFAEDDPNSALIFGETGRIAFSEWQSDAGLERFIVKRQLIIDGDIAFSDVQNHADELFLVRVLDAAQWFYAIPDAIYTRRYNHKPRVIGDETFRDSVGAVAEVLAICKVNGYEKLYELQVDALLRYAVDSFGLILKEPQMLKARAKTLRGITGSKAFRQLSDIAGSYHTMMRDVASQYSLD